MPKFYKNISTKSRRCSVPQCLSRCTNGISLHSFPVDPKLRKTWVDILKIDKPLNKFMYVCSKHFSQGALFRKGSDHQNSRNRLKIGAVPSLNLPKRKPTDLRKKKETRNLNQTRKVTRKTIIKESRKIKEPITEFKFSEVNDVFFPGAFSGNDEIHTLIKEEHAYASSEGIGRQPKNEYLEDDPLKIDLENITIKAEVDEIEIKSEPVDTHYLNSVDVGNVMPIEYLEPNRYITANMHLKEPEVVPKSTFLELQHEYKTLSDLLNARDDRKILIENTRLKARIAKLKKSNEKDNIRLTKKIRDLIHSVKEEAREAAISRSNASKLAIEKEQLKHTLNQHSDCKILENTVTDLKQRLQTFIDLQNTSASNLQILRSQLTLTEKENSELRKALEREKNRLQELVHVQTENAKVINSCNYMKQKMDKTIKMKESLENNIVSFAEEMNKTVAEKNQEIDVEKKRVANLSTQLLESQKTIETLQEKCKNLVHTRGICLKENTIAIMKREQVITLLKKRLEQWSNEVLHYKQINKSLEKQIEKVKTKSCDYCGL